MKLPIDIVLNTNPPKFVWQQEVTTYNGKQIVDHEGMMIPSVESAVFQLIIMTKQLLKENEELRERVHAQSELLSKKAEKPMQPAQSHPQQSKPQIAPPSNFKKNK